MSRIAEADFARRVVYGQDEPVILASSSPRRLELLERLGLVVIVEPPDVDETALDGESPDAQAARLASEKVRTIAANHPGRLVIAADTIVVVDGDVLGKPVDEADAVTMLGRLSGRTHDVITGVAVTKGDRSIVDTSRTEVTFRELATDEIVAYVRTGEPLDKAGAYGAQALGSAFIAALNGCYFNVVGLPITLLIRLIRQLEDGS